ncbi:MAG: late promoter transcription accessory protein [Chitinophagaceae bacterium]|nr:late promoter transcription accessory protein [Chitinophagaceae bacterium]
MLKFQNEIEDIVWKYDVTYMEAIIMFCEENDFEIERVPRLLSSKMKADIQKEAEDLSMLTEKNERLPI